MHLETGCKQGKHIASLVQACIRPRVLAEEFLAMMCFEQGVVQILDMHMHTCLDTQNARSQCLVPCDEGREQLP